MTDKELPEFEEEIDGLYDDVDAKLRGVTLEYHKAYKTSIVEILKDIQNEADCHDDVDVCEMIDNLIKDIEKK